MKKILSKAECELFDLMKSRDVDLHSRIGTIIVLKTEKKYKEMISWIKNNPSAGQYEILGELDVFKKSDAVQHTMPSSKPRKIAVF